jgi:hypothetical protein
VLAARCRARVIGYEPDPIARARLHANLALNPQLAAQIEVSTVTLDGDLARRGLLAERRPHVIVETHSAALEDGCAQLLCDAGYRPRILTRRRRLPENRAAVHNRWLIATGR